MAAPQDWSLEALNEAYRKGYMQALTGKRTAVCPYDDKPVLESAWEAGWVDGGEALRLHRSTRQLPRHRG